MDTKKQSACLIRQSACGLQEDNPVCPKCGLDVRVVYVSKEDGQFAASMAEAQFWKNEAREMLAEKERLEREAKATFEREALEKKKAEQAQRQAEAQAQEAKRLKDEEAKRQAAKERQALEKKKAEQAQRQAEAQALEAERLKAEDAKRQVEKEGKEEGAGGWLKAAPAFIALVLVLGGMSAYRKIDQRKEREYADIALQAMAMAARDEVPAALSPTATLPPSIKDCNECPELVTIPAGSFQMGNTNGDATQQPSHLVEIKSFLLGKYEVTQGQWKSVMGGNPSKFQSCGDQCPVENVTWDDVQEYLKKLNQISGQKYRLPSEAEWEFAAGVDAQGNWRFGDDDATLKKFHWYSANSGGQSHPVGQKMAGTLGLHDTFGNVWEWIQDCGHPDYQGAPNDGSAWTKDCGSLSRVVRGGSAQDDPASLGPSIRFSILPMVPVANVGFRIARFN